MLPSLSRRTLLTLGLSLSLARTTGAVPPATNAFSPLKKKLMASQDAVIFINADSTGYSEHGPFYKMAVGLGARCDASVVLYRWGEWVKSAATGPKAYDAPVTLRTGRGPTLTVYLASLPGQVAGAMFDGSRRPTAIDAIPFPDLCILHHGHNMQTFDQPFPQENASGRGIFFGPLGMVEMAWPGVPQMITTQNPWRDNAFYDKVYASILDVGSSHPGLTLIDSHADFIAAGKSPALFRDNVHPSDTASNSAGAELVSSALLAAYDRSAIGSFTTPAWPRLRATNLIGNGDFADWDGFMPDGCRSLAGGTATKDRAHAFAGFAHAVSLSANGNQNAGLFRSLSRAERERIAGRTVSLAVLVRGAALQPRAFGSLVVRTGGALRSVVLGDLLNCKDGWMWLVASGIPVDAETASDANTGICVYPAFDIKAPSNDDPLLLQQIVLVEGVLPKGAMR